MEDREIFVEPHADGYLLYAPLQGKVMFSKEDLNKKTKDELFEILMKQGVNITSEKDNMDYLNNLPSELVILPTHDCNLRCTYCYASGGDSKISLKLPVAKAAIDFCFNEKLSKKEKRFSIVFTGGGEPTLNWDVLTKSIYYAKELCNKENMQCDIGLVTNGTFSDEKREWILENVTAVSVSFDMLENIQNKQRPFAGNRPSYDTVFNNIKKLSDGGIKLSIRSTISKEFVHLIPEMVRFICSSVKKLNNINIAPAFEMGRCFKTNIMRPDNSEFNKYFLEAKDIADQNKIDMGCFVNLNIKRVATYFCGASADNFVLTPEGSVTSCQDVDSLKHNYSDIFIYGKYDPEQKMFSFDLNKIKRLRERTVNNISDCKNCFVKYNCCGGCAHMAVMSTNNLLSADTSSCELIRSFFANNLYNFLKTG